MSGERILVVDDEPLVLETCMRALTGAGYQVYGAAGGREALAWLEQEHYDLLLLDIKMPDVDGLTVLQQAREFDPDATAVIITGYGTMEIAIGALRAGAKDFLQKPFVPTELLAVVSQGLEQRRQEQENLLLRARLPILEISQALTTECDVPALVRQLLEAVAQQIAADQASIMLLDEQADELYIAGAVGWPTGVVNAVRVPVGQGSVGQGDRISMSWRDLLLRQEPLLLDTAADLEPSLRALVAGPDSAAVVCVPLRARAKVVGVLGLGRLADRAPFTPGDLNLLSIVSGHIATALENTRLYQAAQHGREVAEALQETARVVSASLDLSQVLPLILEQLARVIDCDSGAVLLLNDDRFEVAAARGFPDMEAALRHSFRADENTLSATVMRARRPLVVEDVQDDPRWRPSPAATHVHGWIGAPLIVRDKVIGILAVDSCRSGAYGQQDERLLLVFANQAAAAIENARLFGAVDRDKHEWEATFDAVGDWISLLDLEGHILRTNRAGAQFAGVPLPKMIGQTCCQLTHGSEVPIPECPLQKMCRTHQREAMELAASDGDRWLMVTVDPVIDAGGNLVGAVHIVHDITARKRAEEALARRAAQLALLNDIGGQIVAVLKLDDMLDRAARLVQQSFGHHHVALFMLDRERGELVMRARAGDFAQLFPPEHRLKLGQGLVGWVGRHGETLLANDVTAEPRYVNRYPDVIPTRSELSVPIWVGQEIVGVLDIQSPRRDAFDETDVQMKETLADQIAVAIENTRLYEAVRQELAARQQAEESLRESEERYRTLFEGVPVGLYRTTPDGQILDANPALLAMLSFPDREAALTVNAADGYVNPANRTRWQALMDREGVVRDFEAQWRRRDGTITWVKDTARAVRDADGRVLYYEGALEDITERQQAEEVRQRHSRELALLNRASQAFNSTLDLDQVLVTVLEEVRRLLGVTAASVWLIDAVTDELVCWQITGPGSDTVCGWRLAPGQGIAGWVARHGESVIVSDARADARHFKGIDQHTELESRSILCVLLRVKEDVVGVLEVVDTAVARFKPVDLTLLELLATAAAVAIANARLFEEVQTGQEQLRWLTQQVVAGQEEERRRLSRELHDQASQALTVLRINLELICGDLSPRARSLRQRMGQAMALVDETAQQLRSLAHDLRPPALDTLGLDPALEDLGQDFAERTRLLVSYVGAELPALSDAVNICLYRFLQEALTNVARHASANQVRVALKYDGAVVSLAVEDDGRGFDARIAQSPVDRLTGLGLLGMRERLESVDGWLEVESLLGQGTRLVAHVPWGEVP